MKYSPEFLETNARLKTLDEETLNDELNNMTTDELWAHGDYMIQQTLKEEDLLSEEEAQAHINELLQLTREPVEEERKPIKVHTHRTAKRILILAAAILVLVSVFMVATVASKRDFSILNGIVRFEEGKVHIRIPDSNGIVAMTMTEFEEELIKNGFTHIDLPEFFYENDWRIDSRTYKNDNDVLQVNAVLFDERESCSVSIIHYLSTEADRKSSLKGVEEGITIQEGATPVYLFDHGNGRFEFIYYSNNTEYEIKSSMPWEIMQTIAETVL